uniref:Reelin n=1 Tax=Laticauda laticaudata TaxID=8630 RepID=A0A8C5WPT0_LATLA
TLYFIFVQFFMRLGCGKAVPDPRSQPVLLQYSLNGGLQWNLLQEFLFSNLSNIGRYIALEIPLKARSPSTRLRWWQPSENGHFYSPWVIDQQTWAIDNVYIGDGCIDIALNYFSFFSKGCSRLLVTVDLNLTKAEFIQFYFMYGCLISPNNRNQGVLLEYSVNGGITWTLLMEIFYDHFVNILLPPDAKRVGTRFRWWQPKHEGLDQSDWAIDNVLISGSADQRMVMLDTFSSAPLPQHERSPADAGPTGRIAFDMFVDDRTTGKRSNSCKSVGVSVVFLLNKNITD